jgi:hypothetical protein
MLVNPAFLTLFFVFIVGCICIYKNSGLRQETAKEAIKVTTTQVLRYYGSIKFSLLHPQPMGVGTHHPQPMKMKFLPPELSKTEQITP